MQFKPAVVWLVGEPGTGKTSIARELLGPPPHQVYLNPSKWTLAEVRPIGTGHHPSGVAAAGTFEGTPFDGADTVPYSGAALALNTYAELIAGRARLTLFDGDRFSTEPTLQWFRFGYASPPRYDTLRLKCVHLRDPEVAAVNRRQRELFHDLKPQNEAWLKGRATKAERFAARFPAGDLLVLRNLLVGVKQLTAEITRWLETSL